MACSYYLRRLACLAYICDTMTLAWVREPIPTFLGGEWYLAFLPYFP